VIYPLLIPLLIAAIELTSVVLANQSTNDTSYFWRVLVVFDVIFTSLAVALAEIILVN
jgi:ABC-type transport system involved in cytochrome c biogenesis permease component